MVAVDDATAEEAVRFPSDEAITDGEFLADGNGPVLLIAEETIADGATLTADEAIIDDGAVLFIAEEAATEEAAVLLLDDGDGANEDDVAELAFALDAD